MSTAKTVSEVYSQEARARVLSEAANQSVKLADFQATLQRIRILDVCKFLKERGRLVIDAVKAFDQEHAASRLAEVTAYPDRQVPNPYAEENRAALKATLRSVVADVVDVLGPRMPAGWAPIPALNLGESPWRALHRDSALAALEKIVDQEYPRMEVNFDLQAQAARTPTPRVVIQATGAEAQAPQRRRRPRRKGKDGSPESSRDVFAAGLLHHHGYSRDHGPTRDPVALRAFAKEMQLSQASASRFFKREFNSYRRYRQLCLKGDISATLARLAGETPMRENLGYPLENA